MKRATLTLGLFLVSVCLLRADLTRTEFSKKGDWTIYSCNDEKGKFDHVEMFRTYNGKHEVHLRISFDDENFYMDTTADWNGIPDAKTHAAEYRLDSAKAPPLWTGQATVIEDADGMTWLRITEPNEPSSGDSISNGKKLIIQIGKVQWQFDLKGSSAAFNAMLDCHAKNLANAH